MGSYCMCGVIETNLTIIWHYQCEVTSHTKVIIDWTPNIMITALTTGTTGAFLNRRGMCCVPNGIVLYAIEIKVDWYCTSTS